MYKRYQKHIYVVGNVDESIVHVFENCLSFEKNNSIFESVYSFEKNRKDLDVDELTEKVFILLKAPKESVRLD